MTVRPATPADVPAIVAMERACPTAAHWGEAEYTRAFQAGAVPRIVMVAEEGAVIGFVMVRTVGPEWEIENVAVPPEHRGRGVGSQLLASVATQARERHAEAIVLEVRASNAAARALYRRAGFAEAGQRSEYYAHPTEDAVIYRLQLRSVLQPAP